MRVLVLFMAMMATLVVAASAQASSKQFTDDQGVDRIASDIAGTKVQVLGEDDAYSWADYVGEDPGTVLGFTFPFERPSSPVYHRIFINPDLWSTLATAAAKGAEGAGTNRYQTAIAIMTLTHEAYHLRLVSGDEGRVNACALKAFPDVLSREFGVQPTVTTTKSVTSRVRVRYRTRVHHRWVYRYRWKTTWHTLSSTAPNAAFSEYVADAHDFYSKQPPPYNSGTCS